MRIYLDLYEHDCIKFNINLECRNWNRLCNLITIQIYEYLKSKINNNIIKNLIKEFNFEKKELNNKILEKLKELFKKKYIDLLISLDLSGFIYLLNNQKILSLGNIYDINILLLKLEEELDILNDNNYYNEFDKLEISELLKNLKWLCNESKKYKKKIIIN
jgi:hypothetical protein